MGQKTQNRRIKALVEGIRKGRGKPAKELVYMFTPMVHKLCGTLHTRYNGLVSMDDLLRHANSLLIYLAATEYKDDGGARFPHFIKTHLHARLTQYCRPLVSYRKRVVKINEQVCDPRLARQDLIDKEREEVIASLNDLMWKTFNDRELDVIINHVIQGVSRDKMAATYGVSKQRMKAIQNRCTEKLRRFLRKIKIYGLKDI